MFNKNCLVCGESFTPNKYTPNQKYCSRDCSVAASMKRNEQLFECEYCGGEFTRYVPPSRSTPQFCSPICRNKARQLEPVPCPVCGTTFKPYINDRRNGKLVRKKYCSKECMGEAFTERTSVHPDTTPEHERELVRQLYPEHGADFLAELLGRSRTSIQDLAYKLGVTLNEDVRRQITREANKERMHNDNPMYDPETVKKVQEYWQSHPKKWAEARRKSAEGKARQMRENPNDAEKELHRILDLLGVDYEASVVVADRFIADVRIGNMIIELDGEFWHGHPRFEPLNRRQKRQRRHDKRRDEILQERGYTVHRIWESNLSAASVCSVLEAHSITFSRENLPSP